MKLSPDLLARFGTRLRGVASTEPNIEGGRHGDHKSVRLNWGYIVSCSVLALTKLWLVRRDEVPCLGSPFDDIWYLQSAKDWYWLRSYSELPFGTPPYIRLPAYPLYLAVVNLTGIPLRIANELLLLLAAHVFAMVLIKAKESQVLAILCFAAIVFHPGSFYINSLAYPDSFYSAVLLFSLAGLILLFFKWDDEHRLWYALATGLALAILWHIRQESQIITGFLAVYALLMVLNARGKSEVRVSKVRRLIVLVVTPMIVIVVAAVAVRTVNYTRFGVFSDHAMFTSDFEAAAKALVGIKPKVPIRFVPVPREVRERAYKVSPSFKELEFYFEGDAGRTWASFAPSTGVKAPGEISAGHIWWGLNQAAYYAGYNKSARDAGRFYRQVAAEINSACVDGRLECRRVFSALIDPEPKNWVPYLPHSFSRVLQSFTTKEEFESPRDMDNLPFEVREMVDSVTNRRTALRKVGTTRIRGWAFDLSDNLRSVMVRAPDGQVLATGQFTARPDVLAHYQAVGLKAPLNTGFDLEVPPDLPKAHTADLVFVAQNGNEFSIHRPNEMLGTASTGPLVYAIDEDRTSTQPRATEASVQSFIWSHHGSLIKFLTYLALGGLLLLFLCSRRLNFKDPVFSIMILLLAVIAIRVGLVTFIDASWWEADPFRYIFPVLWLFTCLLLIVIASALRTATTYLRANRAWQTLSWTVLFKKNPDDESRTKPATMQTRARVPIEVKLEIEFASLVKQNICNKDLLNS